jgi:RHH-type rel operon transcriptional repressor/antitoxin RelB
MHLFECSEISDFWRSRGPSFDRLFLYIEVQMLAIRLPPAIEKRLEKLAQRTGRTKTYYVREAILEHLEDLEDVHLADAALERIRSGEEQTIPLKAVMKRHGLRR